jgi:hypothetical protein
MTSMRRASIDAGRAARQALGLIAVLGAGAAPPARAQTSAAAPSAPPTQDYLVFVASEATDQIALIRFGPAGARVERTTAVGIMQTDPDGPHGLGIAPSGRYYYVSTAHGTPYGRLWKLTDRR